MIGCFLVEGLLCAVHKGQDQFCAQGPSAVVQGNKVIDVSNSARKNGVRPLQTRRQAQLCSPDIRFFDYDEPRYAGALDVYLDRCYLLTPVIEPYNASLFFADFRGCDVDGVPQKVLETIFGSGDHLDISVYAGFAPSKFLAWAVSQAIADGVLQAEEYSCGWSSFLCELLDVTWLTARLPVKYLWSLNSNVATELELLGLRTFADVAKAGTHNLIRRYGKQGKKLHSYSTGLDRTPVLPLYPPRALVAERSFELISGDGTEVYALLADAALEIHRKLLKEGQACQRLRLIVFTPRGEIRRAKVFSRPVYSAKQIAWAAMRLLIGEGDYARAVEGAVPADIKGFRVEASALCDPLTLQADLTGKCLVLRDGPGDIERCLAEIAPAMRALERRYGSGLVRTCNDLLQKDGRREAMLSYWDPVRSMTPH